MISQHALSVFLVELRDKYGVPRDTLGRIMLRPTEEPDADRLSAIMDALGDIIVTLVQVTGHGMRDDLSPDELRAREAYHYVHTAMKRLVPGPGEYDAGAQDVDAREEARHALAADMLKRGNT